MTKVCVQLSKNCFVYYCLICIIFLCLNCFSNTYQLFLLVIKPELVWSQCWCRSKFLWMWYNTVVLPLFFRFASVLLLLSLCYASVMLMSCLSYAYVMLLLYQCHCFIVPLLCFHWNEILIQYFSKVFFIHMVLQMNT